MPEFPGLPNLPNPQAIQDIMAAAADVAQLLGDFFSPRDTRPTPRPPDLAYFPDVGSAPVGPLEKIGQRLGEAARQARRGFGQLQDIIHPPFVPLEEYPSVVSEATGRRVGNYNPRSDLAYRPSARPDYTDQITRLAVELAASDDIVEQRELWRRIERFRELQHGPSYTT